MTAAIFGLLGVIVGGMLAAGVEWYKLRDARTRRTRVALRLVYEELLVAVVALESAAEAEDDDGVVAIAAGYVGGGQITTRAWDDHKAVLADELPDDDWSAICDSYFVVEYVAGRARAELLGESLASFVRQAAEREKKNPGLDVLKRLARPKDEKESAGSLTTPDE